MLEAFGQAFRELSTVTVFFHSVIAERLGLSLTDHKAFEIIARKGAVSAGELSELTGLTTGAVTGVIDRLERTGFVRREPDPGDRRRVIIRPHPDSESR
ncbi:MAG: MarR family transcriptional regulator, partial [Candidatus Desulforudis sp.]|nr:MarR family transcriptional regulator [Desulforudis sp.]